MKKQRKKMPVTLCCPGTEGKAITETSSHATHQGMLFHSRLTWLSLCGLNLGLEKWNWCAWADLHFKNNNNKKAQAGNGSSNRPPYFSHVSKSHTHTHTHIHTHCKNTTMPLSSLHFTFSAIRSRSVLNPGRLQQRSSGGKQVPPNMGLRSGVSHTLIGQPPLPVVAFQQQEQVLVLFVTDGFKGTSYPTQPGPLSQLKLSV